MPRVQLCSWQWCGRQGCRQGAQDRIQHLRGGFRVVFGRSAPPIEPGGAQAPERSGREHAQRRQRPPLVKIDEQIVGDEDGDFVSGRCRLQGCDCHPPEPADIFDPTEATPSRSWSKPDRQRTTQKLQSSAKYRVEFHPPNEMWGMRPMPVGMPEPEAGRWYGIHREP